MIPAIHIDLLQTRARGTLKYRIYSLNLGEAAILQLLMIAPVVGHKADDVLREIVHGYNHHEVAVERQQQELIATAVAALGQNLLEIHLAAFAML